MTEREIELFNLLRNCYRATINRLFRALKLKDRLNDPALTSSNYAFAPQLKKVATMGGITRRNSKISEEWPRDDQVQEVGSIAASIIKDKLKIGQLIRTVRKKDWASLTTKDVNYI